ncbi:MAG: DUF499 domain-containing protein [Leptospiraceae bacterium]|nr:DUF499 domain-containing protein [Leptospiraceae bacterium]MCP5501885.1 DUF499 domain-containing protein [Leptospiraceae bacterium]
MNTIQHLCTPRKTVFHSSNREDVLNLRDLIENKIDTKTFFEENYITSGMEILLQNAIERFQKKSDVGLIKLTQAMGGGKTHNMIALGLLAKNPELRKNITVNSKTIEYKDDVRVVAFSGRETDAKYGIWGEIARQLGKFEELNDYYSPLQAPGEATWTKLLQDEKPLLILLDELPPYFETAASKVIGNSDLGVVTTAAIANLLVAVTKSELSNVLIVISDLKASYEGGSEKLNSAIANISKEVGRTALNLEPVKLNTDEIYHILRKKLFQTIPDIAEIKEIANAYGKEIQKAYQMEYLTRPYHEFSAHVEQSYPFHPSVKDLYARFKENSGFNQTRGLIKLLRSVVASIFSEKRKNEKIYLLSPQHFDLNDDVIYNQVVNINESLNNAISKDIAAKGNSQAEELDSGKDRKDHKDTATIIFISSLANIPNAVRGLHEYEVLLYLCEPERDITFIKNSVLSALRTNCWYLHLDREGRFLFKDTQNILAGINTRIQSYNPETNRKELRKMLKKLFNPEVGDVYQEIHELKDLTSIQLNSEKVSLLICEPKPEGGNHPDINEFYENQLFKNRVLFLTGEKSGMDSLLKQAARVKAIHEVIDDMDRESIPKTDPQYKDAFELKDKFYANFYSATRETFTLLIFPFSTGLRNADITMQFSENQYNGEEQIRSVLLEKQKFTNDIDSDTFRKKCETRLFTHQQMEWKEIKNRAATQTGWQWHKDDTLDKLKDKMLRQDKWRLQGKYLDKGPFPPPETRVIVEQVRRDEKTGACTLKLKPENGDKVYYEYNKEPTSSSSQIIDFTAFPTSEMNVYFLCIDSYGKHPQGKVEHWQNELKLKYKKIQTGGLLSVELESIPSSSEITYTLDGSNPLELGTTYSEPFKIESSCLLLAIAKKDGILSNNLSVRLDPATNQDEFEIDKTKELLWDKKYSFTETSEVFAYIDKLKKESILVSRVEIYISTENSDDWIDINYGKRSFISGEKLEKVVNALRESLNGGFSKVSLDVFHMKFKDGQSFLDWVNSEKAEYKAEEIQQ